MYGSHTLCGKIGTCPLSKQTFLFSCTNWSEQGITSVLHVYNVTPNEPKVQVRKSNTTSLLTIMLIERHVSAYSEAIIRFYDC